MEKRRQEGGDLITVGSKWDKDRHKTELRHFAHRHRQSCDLQQQAEAGECVCRCVDQVSFKFVNECCYCEVLCNDSCSGWISLQRSSHNTVLSYRPHREPFSLCICPLCSITYFLLAFFTLNADWNAFYQSSTTTAQRERTRTWFSDVIIWSTNLVK